MKVPLKKTFKCASGEIELVDYSETVPIQYQEGKAEFLGLEIAVDERVLIPRPETEVLVKQVADQLKRSLKKSLLMLDLCTGSGAIALGVASLLEDVRVIASDVSREALSVAADNVRRHGMEERVELVQADMFDGVGDHKGTFDCIVSNPPYISDKDYDALDAWVKAEPKLALHAGDTGMDAINVIAREGIEFLKDGGFMAVEIGYDQKDLVLESFKSGGFKNIEFFKDHNGFDRVIIGWKNG